MIEVRFTGPECDGEDCTDFEHKDGCSLYQQTEAELTAEYEEAVERVYQGRWPEFDCREHGHMDCAFAPNGACSSERVDREIGHMRANR